MQSLSRFLSQIIYYLLAGVLALLVFHLKQTYPNALANNSPFLLIIFVPIFTAYLGGLGPGIFSVIICALLVDYFFIYPFKSFRLVDTNALMRIIVFTIEGIFSVWLITALRNAQQQLIASNKILEQKVTEKTKKMQEAYDSLQQSNKNLQRSNEELENFAYVASHDLQEPLRKIQSFGNLLHEEVDDKLTEDGKLYLDRMLKSTTKMRKLIEDLLSYSRVTRQNADIAPVNLNGVIENVVSDMEATIMERKADISVAILPEVEAIETQMYSLFQNLISNAIRYSKENEHPKIGISGKQEDDCAIIIVKDNGTGFNPKYKDRIFRMYERVHDKKIPNATGIGLAICKKIVDQHHGTIEAQSKENKGTSFIITLPVSQ